MTSNITAGSDTTAILMRAVFYYLFTNRESMQALMSELDTAQLAGELSAIVSWKEAQALPYLDACIKEASRLHPPFGLPLERVVPEGGTTICGQYLPSGTVVGMNAWVVHRDKDVFGHDSNSWRPERWFCDASTRRQMENSLLTVSILIHLLMPSSTENDQFGSGPRSCIGKPIALLEVYKVIPTLLQRYDVSVTPKEDCQLSSMLTSVQLVSVGGQVWMVLEGPEPLVRPSNWPSCETQEKRIGVSYEYSNGHDSTRVSLRRSSHLEFEIDGTI